VFRKKEKEKRKKKETLNYKATREKEKKRRMKRRKRKRDDGKCGRVCMSGVTSSIFPPEQDADHPTERKQGKTQKTRKRKHRNLGGGNIT